MKIVQYIVIKQTGSGYYKKYSSRMTRNNPAIASNEIAVKVSIDIPEAIFNKPSLEAKITVPESSVSQPVIDAVVVNDIQEIIKQNTGFDVKLEVIDNSKEESND